MDTYIRAPIPRPLSSALNLLAPFTAEVWAAFMITLLLSVVTVRATGGQVIGAMMSVFKVVLSQGNTQITHHQRLWGSDQQTFL